MSQRMYTRRHYADDTCRDIDCYHGCVSTQPTTVAVFETNVKLTLRLDEDPLKGLWFDSCMHISDLNAMPFLRSLRLDCENAQFHEQQFAGTSSSQWRPTPATKRGKRTVKCMFKAKQLSHWQQFAQSTAGYIKAAGRRYSRNKTSSPGEFHILMVQCSGPNGTRARWEEELHDGA